MTRFTKPALHAALALAMTVGLQGTLLAKVLVYRSVLSGHTTTSDTGSSATGSARVRVDTNTRRVSVDLRVRGIALDALWKNLVRGPIGPIHFHQYIARAGQPDDVVLVLPLPYGPNYRTTRHGFRVVMKNYDYATGAQLLGSKASFEEFVAAMGGGHVILNVHTDKFTDGEISGLVRAEG